MKKKRLIAVTLVAALALTTFVGCGNTTPEDNSTPHSSATESASSEVGTTKEDFEEASTQETTEEASTQETTEDASTQEATEEVTEEPTEEPTEEVVYADWIDALYSQMMDLDFDDVLDTISKSNFIENCAGYETSSVSSAYENQCFLLPVSTGDEVGVVKVGSEITVFVCPNDVDEHQWHSNGFQEIGYGDIAVVYSEDGHVTCDGIHVKSKKSGQGSFDMEPGGIWIVWSV